MIGIIPVAKSYCGSINAEIKSCTSNSMFRNKLIKAKALWQQDCVLDKVRCAVECLLDSQCLTFSFSSSEGICQGYSNNAKFYMDVLSDAEKNTVFRTCRDGSSHGSTCRRNRDCRFKGEHYKHFSFFGFLREEKSTCYRGVCLCKPGLYYSLKQNACLRKCDDFGDGMDLYYGAGITEYNDKVYKNTTLISCCDLCAREKTFTCLTADWNILRGKCCLSKSGYLNVPLKYREKGQRTWILAQRRCK